MNYETFEKRVRRLLQERYTELFEQLRKAEGTAEELRSAMNEQGRVHAISANTRDNWTDSDKALILDLIAGEDRERARQGTT